MPLHCRHLVMILAGAASAAGPLAAQGSFSEYAGTYEYHSATTLELVPTPSATGERLLAVIDEAKYPLRFLGSDRFLNGVGDTIPFERDGGGRVIAFRERGIRFQRLADTVTRFTATSVVPRWRPRGGRVVIHVYRPPDSLGDGIAVGNVANVGLTRALADTLVRRVLNGTYPNVDGILLYQRGRLVLEEYFYGYDRTRPHQLRSATKSVVSALVGLAIDEGRLAGERERALARLPYGPLAAFANPDPRKETLTLGDLLTMRTGLACDDWDASSPGNEVRIYQNGDWVKAVLDLPMVADPGTVARYCSGGVAVAGRIVERAVGEALPTYAQRALFDPLGIRAQDVRWRFVLDSSNAGTFAQLWMRPRDMLKLGILYLEGGRWRGRQLVSRSWVERSTSPSTRIGSRGYGYLWWHQGFDVRTAAGTRHVSALNASGDGGQKIYIVPELNLVAVFTGSDYNSDRDSPPNAIMRDVLLPAVMAVQPRSAGR